VASITTRVTPSPASRSASTKSERVIVGSSSGHRLVGLDLLQPPAPLARTRHPDAAGQRRLADIQRRDPPDDLLGLLRLLLATESTAMGARRSRKEQAESDPRARGNTEGPMARLPASDQTRASKAKQQRRQRATSPIFTQERAAHQGDWRLDGQLQQSSPPHQRAVRADSGRSAATYERTVAGARTYENL
jgi:hypothetical protein